MISTRLAPLADLGPLELFVNELYAAIQGESSYAGRPCVFVRTAVCHLRCRYCDTTHAFYDGEVMSLDAVHDAVAAHGLPLVELTGGEPLLQPASFALMTRLCDAGYTVLLETSGAVAVGAVDPRVVKIMDIKTPGSGEAHANLAANLACLGPRDEVKLVLVDRADYEWAKQELVRHDLPSRCTVHLSPAYGKLEAQKLAAWMLADRLPARLQLQLHKYIFDPEARGV